MSLTNDQKIDALILCAKATGISYTVTLALMLVFWIVRRCCRWRKLASTEVAKESLSFAQHLHSVNMMPKSPPPKTAHEKTVSNSLKEDRTPSGSETTVHPTQTCSREPNTKTPEDHTAHDLRTAVTQETVPDPRTAVLTPELSYKASMSLFQFTNVKKDFVESDFISVQERAATAREKEKDKAKSRPYVTTADEFVPMREKKRGKAKSPDKAEERGSKDKERGKSRTPDRQEDGKGTKDKERGKAKTPEKPEEKGPKEKERAKAKTPEKPEEKGLKEKERGKVKTPEKLEERVPREKERPRAKAPFTLRGKDKS